MSEAVMKRPDHVPAELVVPFDLYAVPGAREDIVSGYMAYTQVPPIFWTPCNGGHWVVTRPEDIETVASDGDRFSSLRIAIPPSREEDPPMLPLESEGEGHARLRKPLMMALLPKAVKTREASIRQHTIAAIEALIERGACDFVSEFAHKIPVEVFFELADLPLADAGALRVLADAAVRARDADERAGYLGQVYAYLESHVLERRNGSGADLFSRMLDSDAARTLSDREAVTFAIFVLFAGVDTTATVMTMTAHALARDSALRRDLIGNLDDDAFIRNAVEEFIRCAHVSSSTRQIRADISFNGVVMRKGEMVQTLPLVYGYSPDRFEDPFRVDVRRKFPIVHAAFGKGAHLCPGAHLARAELCIFLQEWLRRIPDFQVAPGATPQYSTGVVNAAISLPLEWPLSSC